MTDVEAVLHAASGLGIALGRSVPRPGGHRAGEPARKRFGPVVLVPTLHQPCVTSERVGGRGLQARSAGVRSIFQSKQVLVEMNPRMHGIRVRDGVLGLADYSRSRGVSMTTFFCSPDATCAAAA